MERTNNIKINCVSYPKSVEILPAGSTPKVTQFLKCFFNKYSFYWIQNTTHLILVFV